MITGAELVYFAVGLLCMFTWPIWGYEIFEEAYNGNPFGALLIITIVVVWPAYLLGVLLFKLLR